MGASPVRSRLWLWPALALVIVTIALTGRGTRAITADSAASTAGSVLLPIVSRPSPPQIKVVPFVAMPEGITITVITHAGDERLFVANREGKIWSVSPNGVVSEKPFLDLSGKVVHEANFEQGLLGLAFHPDYPQTPYFYVTYTSSYHIVIARGEVSPTDPNQAQTTVIPLITMEKPLIRPNDPDNNSRSPVHNGGDMKFGPDGYLYIPVGDGGPDPYGELLPGQPGDPYNHSQRRDILFGSILRIDPDPNRGLKADCGVNNALYSIPPSNPWVNDYGCGEIWANGLRNPWRMSFDRLTGALYTGDVGEWEFEEINFLPANSPGGANFGWHCWEGTFNYSTNFPDVADNCDYDDGEFVFPIHQYNHKQGECSVIGGYVYRGLKYPTLYGRYLFGDWCSGRLWTISHISGKWQVDPAGELGLRFTTFGEDVHGELYAGTYENGTLFKVVVAP